MPLRYVCIRLPYRAGLPARNITYPRLPSPESLPSDNYDEDTTSLRQRGLLRFFTGFRHLLKCLCRFQTSICGAKCTFLHRPILYTLFGVLSSKKYTESIQPAMTFASLSRSIIARAEAHTIFIRSPTRNGTTHEAIAAASSVPVVTIYHAVPKA